MPDYPIRYIEFIVALCNSFIPPDKNQLGTFFNDVSYSLYSQSRSGDGFNVRFVAHIPCTYKSSAEAV